MVFSYSAFCSTGQWVEGGKIPPSALPWLRYSHRMDENYLHGTSIFLLPKVYFVQVFIQHTVTNNVIKLRSRRHLLDVLSNRHTFCAKPHYCIAHARSQKFAIGGGLCWGVVEHPAVGGQWGFGGKAPRRRRHGGLGSEPPALENFVFFCKNNFILGLF